MHLSGIRLSRPGERLSDLNTQADKPQHAREYVRGVGREKHVSFQLCRQVPPLFPAVFLF